MSPKPPPDRIAEAVERIERAWPILRPFVALRENKILLAVILGLVLWANGGDVAAWLRPILGGLL